MAEYFYFAKRTLYDSNFFAYFTHLNQYLIFLLKFLLIDFIHATI